MTNKRVQKELKDINETPIDGFASLKVKESNISLWEGLVLPEKKPYVDGAFRILITFPDNYPFQPPKVIFKTKIYHPNVDDKGIVCLGLITAENWKPATRISQVIEALVKLVDDPDPNHALKADIAEQFTKDNPRFIKTAEAFTKKHAERRPKK